ncbi:MAG: short chain dehydrogenase [Frondihabitans sp.]|nr:short chain dehydrogenase [Frondihabitans sp.]
MRHNDTNNKTILISGVSSGFGRALAIEAVKQGHQVVGTVRSAEAAKEFESLDPGRVTARLLDLSDTAAIAAMVEDVERTVGPVDVLVANAGYGHEGLFEESSLDDLRAQFEVNVFGAVALIQAVLPGMRQRRKGRIIGITSVGGLTTSPGLSFYHGSKFAMEGILEALGKEVTGLGIFVTAVAPGPFRTAWSGHSMSHAERRIGDYDGLYEPIRAARTAANGNQPGDPERAAVALMTLIDAPEPPRHLLLGSAAIQAVTAARTAFDDDQQLWAEVARSTDYSNEEPTGKRTA